jgi:hypothetical protein
MRTLQGILSLSLILLFSVRCSGPRVIAFTGGSPDFGSYYTYKIEHPVSPEEPDEEAKQFLNRISDAISNQMNIKNYEMTEVADIVITYSLILDNKADYRMDRTSGYGYNNRYNYPSSTYPYYVQKREYTEGALLVELREGLDNSLIWQASLDMKYNQKSSSKKKIDPVENAFITIFSKYPYIAGNNQPQYAENQ